MKELILNLASWSLKTKYKCPECKKIMYLKEGKYICDSCHLRVQFVMRVGL